MKKNRYLATASIAALLMATGCQNSGTVNASQSFAERQRDYLERHDGVTTHAGNHLAVNEAKMVSDPWKSRAHNTHLHGNGKRTADVVAKYENSAAEEDDSLELALPTVPKQ